MIDLPHTRFNPLHRGIGLLTRSTAFEALIVSSFNPLHRGIGLLTRGDKRPLWGGN